MKSVKLNFLLMLFLMFGFAYQGHADCPPFVESNTEFEAGGKKVWEGLKKIFSFGTEGSLEFDDKLYKYIKVKQIKNQGINGYFNPKIQVCDYEGGNCYELYSGTSCHHIYGIQETGGGISAAAFIDWVGDKMLSDGKIKEGVAKGLTWEWADGVTDKEKKDFANSPKICACSQKGACMLGVSSWDAGVFSGENIFENKGMENVCGTCYQTAVKCAPVPLAPGPPPFCEQLEVSPPQVRIVPITNEDNDYFNPKVGVMISGLGERKELGFQRASHEVKDSNGTTYYFETYRKKDQLCAEYRGTEREKSKSNLQFPARCFPAPPAPKPEGVEIANGNTLKIKIKVSKEACGNYRSYDNGLCTFNINTNSSTNIGPLSLEVVKPAIVAKMTESNNNKSDIDNIIEGILKNNSQFEVLRKYGYVPDIETECKEFQGNKCKLNNLGQPEIEVKYKGNSKSKMLCLSGWQLEPEEFVLERESKMISLKSMRTGYVRYDAVYSKESNQFYYLLSKENKIVDLLKKPQNQLDEIIFNKQGYIFFPEESKQEKGKCSYCVDKNSEIDEAFKSGRSKVVYKLINGKHEEVKCNQSADGCIYLNGVYSRSTQYVDKDNKPFYLKISQEQSGVVKQLEHPIKANRTEVFYADKLCMFDLEGLKAKLKEIIKKQLETKKRDSEEKKQKSCNLGNGYTDDLSIYDYVEIEAWGGGEAGHIAGVAQSTESRSGMPGDYIKTKLKINPSYPIMKVKVTEGGGGQEDSLSNKDGGPTIIEMCDSHRQNCRSLITVAGGGESRTYGGKDYKDTIIHEKGLKLEEKVIKGDKLNSTENNKVAYIEDSEIKYKSVTECNKDYANKTNGAGGCINKDNGSYSKGSPGYVKIRPMLYEINENKIDDAIERMIQNPDDITGIDDPLINKLDKEIIDTIKEEIRKELSGQ